MAFTSIIRFPRTFPSFTMAPVVIMFSTILVAVPAFIRVDPVITSGPGSTVRHRSASLAMGDWRLQQSPSTAQPRSRASFMPPST